MILLKGGEVVSSTGTRVLDVLVDEDSRKIVDVMEVGIFDLDAFEGEVIDCEGKVILPGIIDVHVHFRDFAQAYKEDWDTASRAAVSGGVTTVCDMPNNSRPIVGIEDLEAKRELIGGRSYVNYGLYIAFNGKNVDEINKSDAIAVKFYACDSTGDMGVSEGVSGLFEKCEKLIVVHSEDGEMIKKNREELIAGRDDSELEPALHSKIRSKEAALSMTKRLCELAHEKGVRLHIAHLSTEAELDLLDDYPEVTCEVAPHHLLFCEDDYERFGSYIRMNPPVRERSDLFALWKGLKFGQIDIVATDHAPHTIEEKEEVFSRVPSGVPGVSMVLPIMLNAVNDEGLSLEELVVLCCEKPAEIFGMSEKGCIEPGFDADLVVVDMDLEKKLGRENVVSKCGWSPYEESLLKGWPVMTFVGGALAWQWKNEAGEFVGEPRGKEIVG